MMRKKVLIVQVRFCFYTMATTANTVSYASCHDTDSHLKTKKRTMRTPVDMNSPLFQFHRRASELLGAPVVEKVVAPATARQLSLDSPAIMLASDMSDEHLEKAIQERVASMTIRDDGKAIDSNGNVVPMEGLVSGFKKLIGKKKKKQQQELRSPVLALTSDMNTDEEMAEFEEHMASLSLHEDGRILAADGSVIPMEGLLGGIHNYLNNRTLKKHKKNLVATQRKGEDIHGDEKKLLKNKRRQEDIQKKIDHANEKLGLKSNLPDEALVRKLPTLRALANTPLQAPASVSLTSKKALLPAERTLGKHLTSIVARGQYARLSDVEKHYQAKTLSSAKHYEGNLAFATALGCIRYASANRGCRELESHMKLMLNEGDSKKTPIDDTLAKTIATDLQNYASTLQAHVHSLTANEKEQEKIAQERGTLLGQYILKHVESLLNPNDPSVPLVLASGMTDLLAITQTQTSTNPMDTKQRIYEFWNSTGTDFKSHVAGKFA